jgi:fermentation-respiration switch protein FrsA (DUF1100 family)
MAGDREAPLDRIRCPTLIIHGDADNDVPPRDAQYSHEAIAASQLLWIDKASHIGSGRLRMPQGARYALTGCEAARIGKEEPVVCLMSKLIRLVVIQVRVQTSASGTPPRCKRPVDAGDEAAARP